MPAAAGCGEAVPGNDMRRLKFPAGGRVDPERLRGGGRIRMLGFIPVYLFRFSSERSAAETVRNAEVLGLVQTLIEEVEGIPYAHPGTDLGRMGALEFRSGLPLVMP